LAPLAPGQMLLVHPKDFDRVGVAPGGRVRVVSARGSVQLPLRPDPSTPEGVAFLSFNQPGEGAADLIDISAPVNDIRVETLRS
ncbi:MAG: nitrite reductase, partial [Actinobacteria bacterium]|nr:nitrite reductase [Actinomycetota bacterium]